MDSISAIEHGPSRTIATIGRDPGSVTTVDFSGLIGSGVERLNQNIGVAEQALAGFALGEPVAPHDLMIAMEKARFSLQVAVEVRNRLVEAYGELTRMQV